MLGTALNRFLRATKRLSQLYDFSMHCYSHVVDDLEERLASGDLQLESHIKSQHGFVLHHRVANTLNYAQDYFPKELRSVMLVRLVSMFEVFLIAQLREAAERSGKVFRDDVGVEWARAKIAAFDSVDDIKAAFTSADCRALTSGGFDEVRKYYQKHLDMDICPPTTRVDDIREIHARRHLHVHNGGQADNRYVREFAKGIRAGTTVAVSDEYLRDAIALLRAVATHVGQTAATKYPEQKGVRLFGRLSPVPEGQILVLTVGRFATTADANAYLDLDRSLSGGDGPAMGDVFVGGQLNGTKGEWTILGDKELLKAYFVDLRDAQAKGVLRAASTTRLTPKKSG